MSFLCKDMYTCVSRMRLETESSELHVLYHTRFNVASQRSSLGSGTSALSCAAWQYNEMYKLTLRNLRQSIPYASSVRRAMLRANQVTDEAEYSRYTSPEGPNCISIIVMLCYSKSSGYAVANRPELQILDEPQVGILPKTPSLESLFMFACHLCDRKGNVCVGDRLF